MRPPLSHYTAGQRSAITRRAKQAFEPLTDEYCLVVYDHRGCGQSSLTPPYSNEQYARDAEGLREHLGLDVVVFIGGSYGGFIAREYTIRYPEHLTGVILRDIAPSGEYDSRSVENARRRWPAMEASDLDVPTITWEEFERVMDGDVRSDEEFRRVFHGMAPLYAPSLDEFDAEAAREATETRSFHHETHNTMFTEAYPNMNYTDEPAERRRARPRYSRSSRLDHTPRSQRGDSGPASRRPVRRVRGERPLAEPRSIGGVSRVCPRVPRRDRLRVVRTVARGRVPLRRDRHRGRANEVRRRCPESPRGPRVVPGRRRSADVSTGPEGTRCRCPPESGTSSQARVAEPVRD